MIKLLTCLLSFSMISLACSEMKNTSKQGTITGNIVPDTAAAANYASYCASCHGDKMDAFVDRQWKYGASREDLFKAIKLGYPDAGMPSYAATFKDEEAYALADYILNGIKNRERYDFEKTAAKENLFKSEQQNIVLDTIARGAKSFWGMAFLPNGEMLVTSKTGALYKIGIDKSMTPVKGVPEVNADGQGGLMDVILHPDYTSNGWIYLSYSAIKKENNQSLSTTAIVRAIIKNNELQDKIIIFEALPYARTRHHYGSRMVFGKDGMLYFSVGERGNEKQNPQFTGNDLGKIHRIKDDGSIPADNPFVNNKEAKASIFSYGNRNPQGLTIHPVTGALWSHEHGPRGGDEINIIEAGKNYGWPAISYGINYNGTVLTEKTALPGMEQPLHYWIPSIAPSGMAFVTGNKYKNWQGDVMVGSLRFNYLNRCAFKDGKLVKEELLLKNVGRVRDVKMGNDGYLYVAVENPGFIFRLLPAK